MCDGISEPSRDPRKRRRPPKLPDGQESRENSPAKPTGRPSRRRPPPSSQGESTMVKDLLKLVPRRSGQKRRRFQSPLGLKVPPGLEELEARIVPALPRPDHVVVVIEENHSYAGVIGQSYAPYISSLAGQG